MITIQLSVAQILFDHPVVWRQTCLQT